MKGPTDDICKHSGIRLVLRLETEQLKGDVNRQEENFRIFGGIKIHDIKD